MFSMVLPSNVFFSYFYVASCGWQVLQASSYWEHHADAHKPLVLDLLPYLKEETWDAD